MALIRMWVDDGILASGVFGPIDVFTAANYFAANGAQRRGRDVRPLQWRVESADGRPVRAVSGQVIAVDGRIDVRKRADAVLVGAPFISELDRFVAQRDRLNELSVSLRRFHKRGALIASYCTGAYLLAEAGLLDGRIATTHWARAQDFARRYPRVELRAREVMTEQDRILCSGAATSSLTLAVRLVELCVGKEVAATTARALLIDTNRISQRPYATLLEERGHGDSLVARAQRRMEATLQDEFSLSGLAAHLAVSSRTLHRRFKQALGTAPLKYLQVLRVEVAKRLLESGQVSFEEVSRRVGYADFGTFRGIFKRETSLSPRDYRHRFVSPAAVTHPPNRELGPRGKPPQSPLARRAAAGPV